MLIYVPRGSSLPELVRLTVNATDGALDWRALIVLEERPTRHPRKGGNVAREGAGEDRVNA